MICHRFFLGTGLAILAMGVIGCDYGSPPLAGFDPTLTQETERSAAQNQLTPYLGPLPTTREDAMVPGVREANPASQSPASRPSTGPSLTGDPIVRMTLQEIIHRAVLNNHDVRVAGYQPAIEGTRVTEAQANFDPVFFSNLQYQQKRELTAGQTFDTFTLPQTIFTSFEDDEDIATFQIGAKKKLSSGGDIQIQYQTQYSWFGPQRTDFNPYYESDLTLQLNQPLLRNAGYDVNQAQIMVNRDNQKVSLLEFRKSVEDKAVEIEKDYWQLVQALRDVQIQKDLVAETESTYAILHNRMARGLDVGELQVSQAQTRLESRRGQLVEAKARARDLSDQIKGLMSDPEFPVISPVLILPADLPIDSPIHFNLEDEIQSALANRLELGEQQIRIDAATVTVSVARNNLLPQLNFVGSVGAQGINNSFGKAISSNSQFDHIDFSLGLQFEVPFGNRGSRAIFLRTELQRMAAIESYQALIEKISVEVKTSSRAVETAWELIRQNRRSRFAAEDALRSINAREPNEPLRPEFVQLKLDTQDQLAATLQNEAQAIANYNIALSNLEQAKGTTLKYNNVILKEQEAKTTDEGLLK